MTPADIRALAAKATPGPWYSEVKSFVLPARVGVEGHRRSVGDYAIAAMCGDSIRPEPGSDAADAAYIAALDPQTVLGMLDRLERAEADRDGLVDALYAMDHSEEARDNDHGECSGCDALRAMAARS